MTTYRGTDKEELALADQFLADSAKLHALDWRERSDALAMLNRVACRFGGKTEGEANKKRKPYNDLMTAGYHKLEAEKAAWAKPEYQCPKCGGTTIKIDVSQWATVEFLPEGENEVADIGGDVEWNDNSHAFCAEDTCDKTGRLSEFKTKE
jgi:hypothetical protein